MVRFVLSALGSLWLLSGLLTLHVAATMPRDPSKPSEPLDAARWVMFAWGTLCLILLGPLGLSSAIDLREARRRELSEAAKSTKGPFVW